MIAFEVYHQGKRICRAGIGNLGVLSTHITWAGRIRKDKRAGEEMFVSISGLHSPTNEHRRWTTKRLTIGDEVVVRVISVKRVDRPRRKDRANPKAVRRSKEEYIRSVAQELGWKIDEKPV